MILFCPFSRIKLIDILIFNIIFNIITRRRTKNMKDKNNYYNKMIENLRVRIIDSITYKNNLAHDEVEREFNHSLTYQLLQDLKTNLYLLDEKTIIKLWNSEKQMKEELNSMIKISNNKIVNDIQEEIKKELLKISLENNISLDKAYQKHLQRKKV